MPRRSTSRPAATRSPGHLKARPTRRSAVPIDRRYIAYKYRWRLIDIRKLIGSRRCSGLTVEHQQQTQWCWAAVSNSVSHFDDAGSTWTQCAIVNAELGQTTCCTNGSSAACNQPWYLDRALTRVGCLLSWASGTLSFATVKSLINSTRPPCARQGWSGGGGHFMAIVCYFEGLLGLLAEPAAPQSDCAFPTRGTAISVVDYDVFVSGYQGTGSWTHSYRTQP